MYEHPFQWGSKRPGPDLARVGAKYSDDWHVTHLTDPRAIVPRSVMPGYPFLKEAEIETTVMADNLRTLRAIGVPSTDDPIADTDTDLNLPVKPDNARP